MDSWSLYSQLIIQSFMNEVTSSFQVLHWDLPLHPTQHLAWEWTHNGSSSIYPSTQHLHINQKLCEARTTAALLPITSSVLRDWNLATADVQLCDE